MSYQSYQQAQNKAEDPREIEYRAMGMVTGKLIEAQQAGDQRKLIEAVHLNEKLWALFRADLSQPGNALPMDLRARLISISLWVQRHSSKVTKGEGDIEALIDVNKNIMAGLRPGGAAATQDAGGTASATSGSSGQADTPLPAMPANSSV